MKPPDDGKVRIEIDGPGLTPDTVDPLATIEVARAYFQLLISYAEEHGQRLEFRGLRVEEKCATIASTPSNPSLAEVGILETRRFFDEGVRPSKKLEKSFGDLRLAILGLPSGQRASSWIGQRQLMLVAEAKEEIKPFWGVTTLRVRVVGIDGITSFRARFLSPSEDRAFYLRVSEAQAIELARFFQKSVQIGIRVVRDAFGAIASGDLLEIRELEHGDALDAWREWFARNAPEWETTADIEEALDRGPGPEEGP